MQKTEKNWAVFSSPDPGWLFDMDEKLPNYMGIIS